MSELRLERTFRAPPERVFDAWVDPELLRRWWAAQPDWTTPSAIVDAREGGRYELSMQEGGDGVVHTVAGEYREVERPSRLVYTWAWQDPDAGGTETLVTVEFHDEGEVTRVVLTHSGFVKDESRDGHEDGWKGCLDNLERRVFAWAST